MMAQEENNGVTEEEDDDRSDLERYQGEIAEQLRQRTNGGSVCPACGGGFYIEGFGQVPVFDALDLRYRQSDFSVVFVRCGDCRGIWTCEFNEHDMARVKEAGKTSA